MGNSRGLGQYLENAHREYDYEYDHEESVAGGLHNRNGVDMSQSREG